MVGINGKVKHMIIILDVINLCIVITIYIYIYIYTVYVFVMCASAIFKGILFLVCFTSCEIQINTRSD